MTRKEDVELTKRIEAEKQESSNFHEILRTQPAGSRFVCGYCMKALKLASSDCDCAGWKAATAKLQAMAAENVTETSSEPAVRQLVLSSSAPGLSAPVEVEPRCDFFDDPPDGRQCTLTAGHQGSHKPFNADEFADRLMQIPAREAAQLAEQWVTCDVSPDPHRYSGSCRGVVKSVPAPADWIGIIPDDLLAKSRILDLYELRSAGYLQEVNRVFFHPLGLALAIQPDADGDRLFILDRRDDLEGFVFADPASLREKADLIEAERLRRRLPRMERFGYFVQPPMPLDQEMRRK